MVVSIIGYAEALFKICIAVITIVPRTASSVDWIGGDLAAPFRKSLLLLTVLNVFRNISFEDRLSYEICSSSDSPNSVIPERKYWTVFYYILTSFESFSHTFLMLLMPYLLQKRLSEVINIRPGRDLFSWLQLILLLNVLGIITAPYNSNLWAFKRFGDAIGCIPVIQTLQLFRKVNSNRAEQGNHMTIKTLEVLEGYSFFVTALAAAAYFFGNHHSMVNVAIRVASIFVRGIRTMFHGHLLNVMDDASYVPPVRPSSREYDPESDVLDENENRELIVRSL